MGDRFDRKMEELPERKFTGWFAGCCCCNRASGGLAICFVLLLQYVFDFVSVSFYPHLALLRGIVFPQTVGSRLTVNRQFFRCLFLICRVFAIREYDFLSYRKRADHGRFRKPFVDVWKRHR